jgi:hypothetical protein
MWTDQLYSLRIAEPFSKTDIITVLVKMGRATVTPRQKIVKAGIHDET